MGRFARTNERGGASLNRVKTTARPPFAGEARYKPRVPRRLPEVERASPRVPSERKYFLLAVAALIGLGIGWLMGEAITGLLPRASSPPAAVDQALAATAGSAVDDARLAPPAVKTEPDTPAEPVSSEMGAPASGAPIAAVAQGSPGDTQVREGRRARRGYQRNARGNVFIRPFKALRRFRVW